MFLADLYSYVSLKAELQGVQHILVALFERTVADPLDRKCYLQCGLIFPNLGSLGSDRELNQQKVNYPVQVLGHSPKHQHQESTTRELTSFL